VNLTPLIVERAAELGFVRCGIIPAGPLDHGPHLHRWLADGFHGEMSYMERNAALRIDARSLEPGTRSVIALAAPYSYGTPREHQDGAIAMYAHSDDYHDVLRDRMRALGAFVQAEAGCDVAPRPVVDSAPLLERNVAVDAGIGWLGKSAMVIHPDLGSTFFLAELLVDRDLTPTGAPHPDRCGRCTRCIDLCPTGAIVAPFRVDARRCISYLTIELKGPIPRSLRALVGHRLFGCDVCQSVCPWNTRAAERGDGTGVFSRRPEVVAVEAVELIEMSQAAFSARFRQSPLKRSKRRGLGRNAAVVLGNTGDRGFVPKLCDALESHDEPLVRGHAAWALGVLGGERARSTLECSMRNEPDLYVGEEIRWALLHSTNN